eukprot:15362044-Ditylum_brightwellii.AAC.1
MTATTNVVYKQRKCFPVLDGMQKSKDELIKKELKLFKTHKCTDYFLHSKKVRVKSDPEKQNDDNFEFSNDGGGMYNYKDVKGCQMHFGTELEYDPSAKNDMPRGQPPLPERRIPFDNNGMTSYHARRNHHEYCRNHITSSGGAYWYHLISVHKSKEGPQDRSNLPAYVVITFPSINIPRDEKYFMALPPPAFTVDPDKFLCEKKCCTMATMALW